MPAFRTRLPTHDLLLYTRWLTYPTKYFSTDPHSPPFQQPACSLRDLNLALSGSFVLDDDVKARGLRLRGYANRRLGNWADAVSDLRCAHKLERLNSKWRNLYARVAEYSAELGINIGFVPLDEEVMTSGTTSAQNRNSRHVCNPDLQLFYLLILSGSVSIGK